MLPYERTQAVVERLRELAGARLKGVTPVQSYAKFTVDPCRTLPEGMPTDRDFRHVTVDIFPTQGQGNWLELPVAGWWHRRSKTQTYEGLKDLAARLIPQD